MKRSGLENQGETCKPLITFLSPVEMKSPTKVGLFVVCIEVDPEGVRSVVSVRMSLMFISVIVFHEVLVQDQFAEHFCYLRTVYFLVKF